LKSEWRRRQTRAIRYTGGNELDVDVRSLEATLYIAWKKCTDLLTGVPSFIEPMNWSNFSHR
jgi:hypothetical protein